MSYCIQQLPRSRKFLKNGRLNPDDIVSYHWSMLNGTGRPGCHTMEMQGGSSASYLARTRCVLSFSASFQSSGNRGALRLPREGGDHVHCAWLYSVSNWDVGVLYSVSNWDVGVLYSVSNWDVGVLSSLMLVELPQREAALDAVVNPLKLNLCGDLHA